MPQIPPYQTIPQPPSRMMITCRGRRRMYPKDWRNDTGWSCTLSWEYTAVIRAATCSHRVFHWSVIGSARAYKMLKHVLAVPNVQGDKSTENKLYLHCLEAYPSNSPRMNIYIRGCIYYRTPKLNQATTTTSQDVLGARQSSLDPHKDRRHSMHNRPGSFKKDWYTTIASIILALSHLNMPHPVLQGR